MMIMVIAIHSYLHRAEYKQRQKVCETRCNELDSGSYKAQWASTGCQCFRAIDIKCSWNEHVGTDACDFHIK